MKTITVRGPITRIEGQMKVKISIDNNGGQQRIVGAQCTDPLSRRFDRVPKGNKELAKTGVTKRICDASPISHVQAAVLALENVSNWLPPTNARLLRNLTLGATFLQSHILHFYLFAALDYVTSPVASPWKPSWQTDIRPGLDRVASNLPSALGARRRAHELGAIFTDKIQDVSANIPGGFKAIPTARKIESYRHHLSALTEFIESTYLPDVQLVGTAYSDYFKIGTGCRNLIAFGAFAMNDAGSSRLFSGGYVENGNAKIQPEAAPRDIGQPNNPNPKDNTIKPIHSDEYPSPCFRAPDLYDKPFEGGPLARMWINGDYQRTISVMDRHVARALEAAKIAAAMTEWLDELIPGQNAYDDSFEQQSGCGVGLSESPRGPLGHRVKMIKGKIADYQVITPVCWREIACDDHEMAGIMEQALIGTAIENPDQPVEALRIIHSYDPCLSVQYTQI